MNAVWPFISRDRIATVENAAGSGCHNRDWISLDARVEVVVALIKKSDVAGAVLAIAQKDKLPWRTETRRGDT